MHLCSQEQKGKAAYDAAFTAAKDAEGDVRACPGYCKDVVQLAGGNVADIAQLNKAQAFQVMENTYLPKGIRVRECRLSRAGCQQLLCGSRIHRCPSLPCRQCTLPP